MLLVTYDACIILAVSPSILSGQKKNTSKLYVSHYSTQICFLLRIIKKELKCTKICMHKNDIK